MKASKTDLILQALLRGESLTQMDALNRFHCMRFAARIKDLRARGYDIVTRAESNGDKHYARYFLKVPPPQLPPAFPEVELNQTSLF